MRYEYIGEAIVKKFFREYTIEIIAVAFIAVGLFLLLEQMEVRTTVRQAISNSINFVRNTFADVSLGIKNFLISFTLSDALGLLLIILAIVFILWRIRYRYLHSDKWLATTCPKCGGRIYRVHRSRLDRFIGWVLLPKARRYRCSNDECSWTGLRRHGRRRKYIQQIGEPTE